MKNSYKLNSYTKINKLKDEERKKNSFINEKQMNSRIRSEAKVYNPEG